MVFYRLANAKYKSPRVRAHFEDRKPPSIWTTEHVEAGEKTEEVDSFYAQVKPLSFFEFILGHFLTLSCGSNTWKEHRDKETWGGKELHNILALVMIGIPTLGLGATPVGGDSLDLAIIYEIIVILHFLTLKVCISSRPKLHHLVHQIHLLDRSFSETFAFSETLGRNFWWGCLWFCLTITFPVPALLFVFTEVLEQAATESRILQLFSLCFHGATVLQRSLIFVHFMSLGWGIKCRFGLLKRLLETELGKENSQTGNLEQIRIHHARLSVLVDLMNESSSKRLIFPILTIAIECLFIFYRYIFIEHLYIHPFIALKLAADLLLLKLLATISEATTLESRAPLYVVRAVIISKLPFLCQSQVMMFQDQVLAVPVQISAGGFFYLDNKLLTELALLIVTYCTVILQLVPNQDEEEEGKDSNSGNRTSPSSSINATR